MNGTGWEPQGLAKYECCICEKQFLVGLVDEEKQNPLCCPFCKGDSVENTVYVKPGDEKSDWLDEMGCMGINHCVGGDRVSLNKLAIEIHENAKEHGWWDEERTFGEIIALCHSELSEALEEYRNRGNKPLSYYVKHPPENALINLSVVLPLEWRGSYSGEKPEGMAIEMIDCMIRILDWCGKEGVDVDALLQIKHEYNKTRPYKHGNKRI